MLIDKGLSAGDVVTIKLTSGEELVARLQEERDDYYKLSKVMVIAMGQHGPGLMPYLFTVPQDATIKLSKSTVTVATLTEKSFATQYLQSTSSVLV